ncbi:hypothetical protein [Caenispirillum salinarum]|uniref:hypothetical protein n=1 Tax=Caenispirillum salinarum TaxID=859058 RepID=UPI00384B9D2B
MIQRLLIALLLCAAVLGGVAPAWAHEHGAAQMPAGHGSAHDHHHAMTDDGAACTTAEGRHAGHDTPDAAGCPGAASACGGSFAGWPTVPFDIGAQEPAGLPQPGAERHMTALALSPDLRPPRTSS